MKNKKLFAILTLICFALTMMPVAAFAGDAVAVTPESGAYLTVNGEDKTVAVKAGDIAKIATTGSELDYYFFLLDAQDNVTGRLPLTDEAGSSYDFDTKSLATGTYKVYAVVADSQVEAILDSSSRYAAKVDALFADHSKQILDPVTLRVREGEKLYQIALNPTSVEISADNGFSGGVVTATLTRNGEPVKGAKLTFDTAGFVTATAIDATTDRSGKAKFKVAATKAGEYKVYVNYGDVSEELSVTVKPVGVANVAVEKEPKAPVALESVITKANVQFAMTDVNGAACKACEAGKDYNLTVVGKPADSGLTKDDVKLVINADGNYVLTSVDNAAFDEEGTYSFKVALRNGNSATASVEVKKYDKTVAIRFAQTVPGTVAIGGTASYSDESIEAVDANGVTKPLTGVKFSVNGKAVKNFANKTMNVQTDDKYIGSVISVIAVATDNGKTFTATKDVTVIDVAASIKYDSLAAEVAVNNTLVAKVVDANGNKVNVKNTKEHPRAVQVIVIAKPENAIAVADANFNTKNEIETAFLASVAGEYTIQTIVTYFEDTADATEARYVSSIDTITVGKGAGTFKDVVVMPINAAELVKNGSVVVIPVASAIVDGRTMVPLRALIEAFGAAVDYDAATQSITATFDGVTVVMTVGSTDYTVNGAAKTCDVAPYVVGEGYTMVPVRFVATAFGITPTPIYDENKLVSDVLFAK